MSQIDNYKRLVDEINEYEFGFEMSKMAMLSLIAENTAIIADSMSRPEVDMPCVHVDPELFKEVVKEWERLHRKNDIHPVGGDSE